MILNTVDNDLAGDDDRLSAAPPPSGPNTFQATLPEGPDWHRLVERIQSGTSDGMEELYQLFSRGVRFYLCRQLGPQELDHKVHDTFLIAVEAIQLGELRDPEPLMSFV